MWDVSPGRRVSDSEDLRRILALPRRPPPDADRSEALVEHVTAKLARARQPGTCRCASWGRPCIRRLKPTQAWVLHEAPRAGGIFGAIGVGEGKTILDILIALVMPGCDKAVLLIPPGLRKQLLSDYLAVAEHFLVPSLTLGDKGYVQPNASAALGRPGELWPVVHVVPYSQLSRPESTVLLDKLKPKLFIADEAHRLRDKDTATTGRVLRFWLDNPETRLCAWSGTLMPRSIKNGSHLMAWALGAGSPLPLDQAEVDSWAGALDPSPLPAHPGALLKLGSPAVDGVRARITETLGVITTAEASCGATLNLYERVPPEMPAAVHQALRELRNGWQRPDGEELIDALALASCAHELACGFFYRWKFPRGEPEELIAAWFAARKSWHATLRHKLERREPYLDSEGLCTQAAVRGWGGYKGPLPVWRPETWPVWADVKDQVEPEPDVVWIDDWLARDAAAWAKKHRGIVWYGHVAFGLRVAELVGLPLHGGGPGARERLLAEGGARSVIVSIDAHGTGLDGLQRQYREQLIANPPGSGDVFEQLLGRLHRPGQDADEVDSWVFRHTSELKSSIDNAVRQAKFASGILPGNPRLLSCTCDFDLGTDEDP